MVYRSNNPVVEDLELNIPYDKIRKVLNDKIYYEDNNNIIINNFSNEVLYSIGLSANTQNVALNNLQYLNDYVISTAPLFYETEYSSKTIKFKNITNNVSTNYNLYNFNNFNLSFFEYADSINNYVYCWSKFIVKVNDYTTTYIYKLNQYDGNGNVKLISTDEYTKQMHP